MSASEACLGRDKMVPGEARASFCRCSESRCEREPTLLASEEDEQQAPAEQELGRWRIVLSFAVKPEHGSR